MYTMRRCSQTLILAAVCIGLGVTGLPGQERPEADSPSAAGDPVVYGEPLGHWVAQANAESGPDDPEQTVKALSLALESDDHSVKVAAADALAVLGPGARPAVPVLIGQLGHEQPWVRVAAMGALAAVGKEAVPALIETFQTKTGGPRIRAAFVMGGIGPDAKAAVPVLAEAMKRESPVMQDRILGILSQIDPKEYAPKVTAERAQYDEAEAGGPDDAATTDDWAQFHGPRRDSRCREGNLLDEWPDGGPKLLWKLEGLGRGYSTVSIADGRMFTMGDRTPHGQPESQFVVAYDLTTRQELWATPVGGPHMDGPRSTPTVDGDLLYAIGTDGNLACLEAATGTVRWQKSLPDDFGGKMMSVWKFTESPLVDGGRVICTPGGPEATMVALDKRTGDVIWKSVMPDVGPKGTDGAAYSSAVVAEIGGVRQYVQLVGRGVIGVDARSGRFLWGYNRIANTVANVTTPVVRGSYVFTTTAYSTGGALLKITRRGRRFQAQEVYFINARDFQNHHGGVVLVGDHIYGGHGPNKGDPTCIELSTGKVAWKERAPARGSAGVLYADGRLIFRYDRGEVVLIDASPDGLQIKGRFTAPTDANAAWSHPVIHEGKLYLRHSNLLLCYDLRAYE